jgi:hypothetical protein
MVMLVKFAMQCHPKMAFFEPCRLAEFVDRPRRLAAAFLGIYWGLEQKEESLGQKLSMISRR